MADNALSLFGRCAKKNIIWDHKKSHPQKQVGNFLFVFILCVVFNSIETSSFNASTSWPFLAAHLEAPLFCNSPFALTQVIHRLLWVTSAGAPTPLPATFGMISLNMKIEPLRGTRTAFRIPCRSLCNDVSSSKKSRPRTTHFVPKTDAILCTDP